MAVLTETKPETKQFIPALHIPAGIFTLENLKTGTWKTFKIKTQPADHKFKPGARLVGMLMGRDNNPETGQYVSIGEIRGDVHNGHFHCWNKWKGTEQEKQCRFLINMLDDEVPNRNIRMHSQTFCLRCSRALTTPNSVINGYGSDCAKKISGGIG